MDRRELRGGILTVGCGFLCVGLGASLYWLVPVDNVTSLVDVQPGMEAGFEYAGGARSTFLLGLLGTWVLGVAGIVSSSGRNRVRKALLGATAILGVAVLTLQVASLGHSAGQWTQLGEYLLLDTITLGGLAALGLFHAGHRRLSGLVVQLTGFATLLVTVLLVLASVGRTGIYPGAYPFVAGIGVYVTLGGGVLLVIGGALLVLSSGRSGERPVPEGADASSSRRSDHGSLDIGVTALLGLAVVGAVAGTWLEWFLPLPISEAGSLEGSSSALGASLLAAVVIVGVVVAIDSLVRSDRPRRAGRVLVLVALIALGLPIVLYAVATGMPGGALLLDRTVGPGALVTFATGTVLVAAGARLLDGSQPNLPTDGPQQEHTRTGRFSPGRLDLLSVSLVGSCGWIGVLVGTWLDWAIRINGTAVDVSDPVPMMETGFLGSNAILLGAVVLGITIETLIWVVSPRLREASGLPLLGTGIAVIALVGARMLETLGPDGFLADAVIAGPGVYVTLGGGVMLAIGGALRHELRKRGNDARRGSS